MKSNNALQRTRTNVAAARAHGCVRGPVRNGFVVAAELNR